MIEDEAAILVDCPIAIEIDTRSVPKETPIPDISDLEWRLAETILRGLPQCLQQCEQFLEVDPTIRHIRSHGGAQVVNPHIWISREIMDRDGPNRWAMVLGVDVNPDFGWHIEFDGLTALEIWAGD